MTKTWQLPDDRYFDTEPSQKNAALEIYAAIQGLPLICPHGHVGPNLFTDSSRGFGTPVDLLLLPDHYIYRLFYSQGLKLESFGIPRRNGELRGVEQDHRKIWQRFADNFHLLRTTASYIWLAYEFKMVFGIEEVLDSENAMAIYDALNEKLRSPEFQPRALFKKMNIEVLCTTDAASDSLAAHQQIADSWDGKVLPTFRPDAVTQLDSGHFKAEIKKLEKASDKEIDNFKSYIKALEKRRAYFKKMGAVATDHSVLSPVTSELSENECNKIFRNGLNGKASLSDAKAFAGHMLSEMARMSCEDKLVMQLHPGIFRNHNAPLFEEMGADRGGDIPVQTDFTKNLRPLLNQFGNNPRLTLCLYSLDESAFSRELAPLAGHYPSVRLGTPWWFIDNWNGMTHFLDTVPEIAGVCNLSGFVDDTRAFPSIPARHDLWRRVVANWLAKMTVRSFISLDDAKQLAKQLIYDQPKAVFNL